MRKKLMTLLLSMSLFGTLGGCHTTDISGVSNDDVQHLANQKKIQQKIVKQ